MRNINFPRIFFLSFSWVFLKRGIHLSTIISFPWFGVMRITSLLKVVCVHMTDVASAILVSQNNETVVMLVS